jgi:3-oxoacyl-[acyl-carrier protein] reductase
MDSTMSGRFEGKAALVTGAGHGIGRQIAMDFAAEGASVGVNDINPERTQATVDEILSYGGKAKALPADIRYANQVQVMVDEMVASFGGINILVNNAGIYPNNLIVNMPEEEWDRVWDTNVKGMFLVTRAVARCMIGSNHGGKIVNISSSAAIRARVGASHYCSSKAAISMFTKVVALELAEYKINVNAVAPGLIEVPDWDLAPEYIETYVKMTPWRRIGVPQDISNVVRYLATDEIDFMTGSIVLVDGGVAAGQNLPLS